MSTSVKRARKVALVLPSGDLRQGSTDELIRVVTSLTESDAAAVIISLRDVSALLSEGIRALVMLHDRVTESKRAFFITDLPIEVQYTLKVTNLLEFLNHVPSLEKCLVPYGVRAEEFQALPAAAGSPVHQPEAEAPETAAVGKPVHHARPKQFQAFGMAPPSNASATSATPTANGAQGELTREDLETLISRYMPSRLAVEVVECIVRGHKTTVDENALSHELGVNRQALQRVAADLAARGILRHAGAGTYRYAPPADIEQRVQLMLQHWRNPAEQPHILALLLSSER